MGTAECNPDAVNVGDAVTKHDGDSVTNRHLERYRVSVRKLHDLRLGFNESECVAVGNDDCERHCVRVNELYRVAFGNDEPKYYAIEHGHGHRKPVDDAKLHDKRHTESQYQCVPVADNEF